MIKVKTAKLIGSTLDWAVAKTRWPGRSESWILTVLEADENGRGNKYEPSTNQVQGGQIIDSEFISTIPYYRNGSFIGWTASLEDTIYNDIEVDGPTRLIAAMRCYVMSKLGPEILVPGDE